VVGLMTREKWMMMFIVGLMAFAILYYQNSWTF
jgi:hypothetical protein